MQKTSYHQIEPTIGEFLLLLSQEDIIEEKKSIRKKINEMIKTRYPLDDCVFKIFIRAANNGRTNTSLKRGVLIPDLSDEGIKLTIIDGCTVVDWSE